MNGDYWLQILFSNINTELLFKVFILKQNKKRLMFIHTPVLTHVSSITITNFLLQLMYLSIFQWTSTLLNVHAELHSYCLLVLVPNNKLSAKMCFAKKLYCPVLSKLWSFRRNILVKFNHRFTLFECIWKQSRNSNPWNNLEMFRGMKSTVM